MVASDVLSFMNHDSFAIQSMDRGIRHRLGSQPSKSVVLLSKILWIMHQMFKQSLISDHSKAVVTLGIQMYRLDFIYLNFVFSFLDKTKNFKFKYIKSFSFPKSKPSTLIILKIKIR
jgi:hypothetical protein